MEQSIAGASIHNLKASIVYAFEIPLPPLEVQQQIVAEIEGYQASIEEHKRAIAALEVQIKSSINNVWGN